MKVLAFPADHYGCGHHRIIWVCQTLAAAGHDVTSVLPENRHLAMYFHPDGRVGRVNIPRDVDVVVLQRVTHPHLVGAIEHLRSRGVAVIVDIDDDLHAIHPSNPAFTAMHPKSVGVKMDNGQPNMHNWQNLTEACKRATMVTVSTPALLPRYAAAGNGRVLPNYLADHYYGIPREDSDSIGWPASLHSHPDDPSAVGNAVARIVNDGADFRIVGDPTGCGAAFKLGDGDPYGSGIVDLTAWPTAIAKLGVGICPLADTRFNAAKSWLKPLELAAAGVPWVGSPRTEYQRLHDLGCGLLAERPKSWYRMLYQLRQSEAWRDELSEAGRAVAETLRLRDHAWRWWETWTEALRTERRHQPVFKFA